MLTVVGFFILLATRIFVEPGTSLEISGDLVGASIIAWGGFLNRSLCHCHGCHDEDDDGVIPEGREPSSVSASTVQ